MVHLGRQSLGRGASRTHLPGVLAPLWASVCFLGLQQLKDLESLGLCWQRGKG